jgi:hypothetical protein
MARIQNLPRLTDGTIYIVGTGASLRCLPMDWFHDKCVIGLNQAWRHLHCTYSITVHPELVQQYESERKPGSMTWIIKKKPPMAHLEFDDPKYFVFVTSYDLATVCTQPKDTLYLGEGVQTCAMDLAARLGAKFIVLVGCDAKALGGDYHAHDQHTRWVGRQPNEQYMMYRNSTADVRKVLREMGVSVMTLSPFIGVDAGEEDYHRLRNELKLDPLPEPKDISPKNWKPPKR